MKMKMKALSVALGASLGAASLSANAEALLFPFFASGNGQWSFMSLRTDRNLNPGGGFNDGNIHYVWVYDDPVLGPCTHADQAGGMSAFDLIQQNVIAGGLPGGVDIHALFGDASAARFLSVSPTQGFVIVKDGETTEATMGGQMILINALSGLTTAYKALNDPANTPFGAGLFGINFSSIFVSQFSHDVSWYPADRVNTQWFVLVTGNNMGNPAGWTGTRQFFNGFATGVFNRDEVPFSGSVPFVVECYDTITRNDFMNANQLANTAGGGWNWLVNVNVGGSDGTGALMWKIESTNALGAPKTAISAENAFPNLPY